MVRILSLVLLGSSSMALAQAQPVEPAPQQPVEMLEPSPPVEPAPVANDAPEVSAEVAPPVEDAAPEEPLMKKVCHTEDVVGSAFPRKVCKMKPVRTSDKPKAR